MEGLHLKPPAELAVVVAGATRAFQNGGQASRATIEDALDVVCREGARKMLQRALEEEVASRS